MPRQPLRNDSGKIIDGIRKLKHIEYGTGKIDANGNPIIDWENNRTDNADEHGFDTDCKEFGDSYYIEMNLPYDTRLIRYGSESGSYTAPHGTDYDDLALPYIRETVEYHEYKVIADSLRVFCHVHKGIVAPMFDSNGGAIQYFHPEYNVQELIKTNILERIVHYE